MMILTQLLLFSEICLFIATSWLLLPTIFLLIECSAALLPKRPMPLNIKWEKLNIAILIPAHNEALVIAETLQSLLSNVTSPARIIVIADNCTDCTAEIARQFNIIVLERDDSQFPGKGYALDYGLQFLADNPSQVVVFLDADCTVTHQTISSICQLAHHTQRPVQTTYLMETANSPQPRDIVSMLALLVKNLTRPFGLARLGLPCLLTGSGMAFPWVALQQICLAGNKTADDMQLSVDLAIAGYSPLYCPEGQVIGRLMEGEAGQNQRRRWEHGHLEMLLTQVPRLLKNSVAQWRLDLLTLALEISIPPLSLLVIIWLVLGNLCLLLNLLGGSLVPFLLSVLGIFSIILSIATAWVKFGRDRFPLFTLMAFFTYIWRKIPIHLSFLTQPQTRWLKTERDSPLSTSGQKKVSQPQTRWLKTERDSPATEK